jgi:hypothetical protein
MIMPLLSVLACQPALESAAVADNPQPPPVDGAPTISLEPEAALDSAPAVLRIRLRAGDAEPVAPQRLALVRGEISSAQLGQLARDEPSKALSERIVPSLIWSDPDGSLVLAPTRALARGESYALASGTPRFQQSITVMAEDPLPLLALVWPPEGVAVGVRSAVWCGATPLPFLAEPITLEPAQVQARLRSGAIHAVGDHCVHLEQLTSDEPALLPPPLLLGPDGAELARLEPIALRSDGVASPLTPVVCGPDEQRFGPGCLRVSDDRAWLATPEAPVLWAIADDSRHTVVLSQGDTLVLGPFEPATATMLTLETLDLQGNSTLDALRIDTLAAMPHVVINEVLANPVGEEPEQEWVELYNDGSVPAQLGGYLLEDIGGEIWLPELSLGPGEYAVLVNATFDPTSDYDPLPAADAKLVVVEKLGKNGLNNQGEPLKLSDANGELLSRFPTSPKPKAGRSVMRTHPKALDADPASFVLSAEGASTPGAAN